MSKNVRKGLDFKSKLKDLEEIVLWFEKQKDADIEEGIEKVKLGVIIAKELEKYLQDVENEFNQIKNAKDKE